MHFYPFHISDFRSGTIYFNQLERWVYRDLIDVCYDTEAALPIDHAAIYRMVGARTSEHKEAVDVVLAEKFEKSDIGYSQMRITSEIEKYHKKANSARNANQIRWGSEKVLKSDAPQTPEPPPAQKKEPATQQPIKPEGVSDTVWKDFCAHRKVKKAKLTDTALNAIISEADKAGWSLQDALTECCTRGWTGFKADWIRPTDKTTGQTETAYQRSKREQMERDFPNLTQHKEPRHVATPALG